MTAINHYIDADEFNDFSNRDEPQNILAWLREEYFSPAILGTPDMKGLDLSTDEWKTQAGNVMDVNVLMFGNKVTQKTLYVPKNIFDQIWKSVDKVAELLRWTTQIPICIKPMLSDKDVFMFRSINSSTQELCDDTGRIKDTIEREFGENNEAIYEGIIIPQSRAVVGEAMIVLEWYDTSHRIDKDGDFQRIMRENAPIVDGIIRGLEWKSDSPVSFNFSASENFEYA